ncbi:hypothetical protein [Leptotrichia trevisanii]
MLSSLSKITSIPLSVLIFSIISFPSFSFYKNQKCLLIFRIPK